MERQLFILLAAAVLVASCTPVDTAPVVTPQGEDRYLIDPRVGWHEPIAPPVNERFEMAWRHVVAGNEAEARKRLTEILTRNPNLVPAQLAEAVFEIRSAQLDRARGRVQRILESNPDYLAAQVYQAEIALRARENRAAYDLYRAITARPDAPQMARERVAQLQEALFNEIYAAAQTAPTDEAIRLLREALTFNAGATEARILLAQKLLGQGQFEEARNEIDPLLNTDADRAEVQTILAEVEVGRGRYQEAIVRYERLAKRTNDAQHTRRLEEIKREWRAANLPPHVRNAMSSTGVTRAELATLLYWNVPAVRFAQNLGAPMIAVDIEDVDAREEIIRAIALGLFDVDPVTRRVSPNRIVTASRLSTFLARVLSLRGAACARAVPIDRVLESCSVPDPLAAHPPDSAVPGRDVVTALEQVAKQF